ncbi:hypothetical protein RFW13_17065 [Bacillus pumilus]|uniref:hypothetical protein n=1 Tax=Bacillus pumilus TaxID=1408 RepID=UPI0028131A23|nr:hypothetical protein [Bacillus pumilus]MDR0123138.1 hypothetical protein [Bacillus pumilus]
MPIGKQLKHKLAKTNAFEKKHTEFLKGLEEFNNNKELQNKYQRVQDVLKESIEEVETGN